MRLLSRDEFCNVISQIYYVMDYQDKLNDFLHGWNEGGYLMQPDCMETCTDLLEFIFSDTNRWISYWVWELDFGKYYTEGAVTDKDGNPIPLRTAEDLYHFLIENLKEGGGRNKQQHTEQR